MNLGPSLSQRLHVVAVDLLTHHVSGGSPRAHILDLSVGSDISVDSRNGAPKLRRRMHLVVVDSVLGWKILQYWHYLL